MDKAVQIADGGMLLCTKSVRGRNAREWVPQPHTKQWMTAKGVASADLVARAGGKHGGSYIQYCSHFHDDDCVNVVIVVITALSAI